MVTTADLRVLQLIKHDERFTTQGLVQGAEESLGIPANLLVDLVNVAFDSEEVSFYACALGAQLCSHLCHKNLNARSRSSLQSNSNLNFVTYLADDVTVC